MAGILAPRNYSVLGGTPLAPTPMTFTPPAALAPGRPAGLEGRPVLNWLSQNSDALAGMSAGLLSGQTTSDAFGRGFAGFAQGRQVGDKRRKEEREEQERRARIATVSDWAQSRVASGQFTDADAKMVAAYPELAGQFMKPSATERKRYEVGNRLVDENGTVIYDGGNVPGFRPLTNPAERQRFGIAPNDTAPYQVSPDGEVKPIRGAGAGDGGGFDDETKLRGEFLKQSQDFVAVRDGYSRLQAASRDQTGASDIALVYGFMKMLDPGSVVREGEFATAANAGGIPDRVIALYNSVLNGEKLSDDVRASFLQQGQRQFEAAQQRQAALEEQYRSLSEQYRFDPRRITPDMSGGVTVGSPSPAAAPGAAVDPSQPPAGVSPEEWNAMTPEERALWQ